MRTEVRSRLLKAIAQGRIWQDALITDADQTIHGLAKLNDLSERSIRSTINLALLAPDIIQAAIEGRLPRGITVTQMTDLSPDWTEQRRSLGLA